MNNNDATYFTGLLRLKEIIEVYYLASGTEWLLNGSYYNAILFIMYYNLFIGLSTLLGCEPLEAMYCASIFFIFSSKPSD